MMDVSLEVLRNVLEFVLHISCTSDGASSAVWQTVVVVQQVLVLLYMIRLLFTEGFQ